MKTKKKGNGAASKRQNELKPLTDEQRRMVETNMPLAKMMSRKYAYFCKSKRIDEEDLMQEACLGLCIAAQNFDISKGAQVKTYAYNHCLRMVLMAIDSAPDIAEDDVETLQDEPIYDEDEADYEENRWQKAKAAMSVLNVSERKVVELVFGFRGPEKSVKEVAKIMNLQVARIRELLNKALNKMEMASFPADSH